MSLHDAWGTVGKRLSGHGRRTRRTNSIFDTPFAGKCVDSSNGVELPPSTIPDDVSSDFRTYKQGLQDVIADKDGESIHRGNHVDSSRTHLVPQMLQGQAAVKESCSHMTVTGDVESVSIEAAATFPNALHKAISSENVATLEIRSSGLHSDAKLDRTTSIEVKSDVEAVANSKPQQFPPHTLFLEGSQQSRTETHKQAAVEKEL